MSNEEQTVYIVDDDPAISEALGMLLDSVHLNYAQFGSADDFLAAHAGSDGGCLVLDIRMPGMSGLELQRKLVAEHCTLPIIFITGHGDVPMAVEAMRRGAFDFIGKPFREQELLDRIQAALDKDAAACEQHRVQKIIQNRVASLTERELDVFNFVAEGNANKIAAIELGISERTVEVHRASIMKKLAARSLADVVKAKLILQELNAEGLNAGD